MKTSPVFHYVSQCCNSVATKPACLKVKEAPKGKFKTDKQKAPEFASLGKWRCGACKKVAKVSRVKATSEVSSPEVTDAAVESLAAALNEQIGAL